MTAVSGQFNALGERFAVWTVDGLNRQTLQIFEKTGF